MLRSKEGNPANAVQEDTAESFSDIELDAILNEWKGDPPATLIPPNKAEACPSLGNRTRDVSPIKPRPSSPDTGLDFGATEKLGQVLDAMIENASTSVKQIQKDRATTEQQDPSGKYVPPEPVSNVVAKQTPRECNTIHLTFSRETIKKVPTTEMTDDSTSDEDTSSEGPENDQKLAGRRHRDNNNNNNSMISDVELHKVIANEFKEIEASRTATEGRSQKVTDESFDSLEEALTAEELSCALKNSAAPLPQSETHTNPHLDGKEPKKMDLFVDSLPAEEFELEPFVGFGNDTSSPFAPRVSADKTEAKTPTDEVLPPAASWCAAFPTSNEGTVDRSAEKELTKVLSTKAPAMKPSTEALYSASATEWVAFSDDKHGSSAESSKENRRPSPSQPREPSPVSLESQEWEAFDNSTFASKVELKPKQFLAPPPFSGTQERRRSPLKNRRPASKECFRAAAASVSPTGVTEISRMSSF